MKKMTMIFLLISTCFLTGFSQIPPANTSNNLEVTDTIPLQQIKETPGYCSIFREWGFVGNSLTSGEHEYINDDGKKGYLDLYEYSWGQFICYATGAKGENFSKGGLTCRSWINKMWEKAKQEPKQAYIIALGVNDRYKKYALGDFSTDIDSTDFEKNADTFIGNYAGIIQRLKSIQPKAKIFVCTLYKRGEPKYNESVEMYNDVIRQMEKRFSNLYTIDLYKYAPVNDDAFRHKFYNGGHNNAVGYLYSSWLLMTYIDWIVCQDFREFAEVALIGENKSLYK